MKTLFSALVIIATFAPLAEAQWWKFGMGKPEPPAVVDCVLQDRDWERFGPLADKKELNQPCVLTTLALSTNQWANVKDPEWFAKARVEALTPPTKAAWVNEAGFARQSQMNPMHLSTPDQAERVAAALKKLYADEKLKCDLEVKEAPYANAFSVPVWGDEARRPWMVGQQNVGLVVAAYARFPASYVETQLLAEKQFVCAEE